MKSMLQMGLRFIGMLLGIIGALIALLINAANSTFAHLTSSNGSVATHGWIGLGLIALGLIGSFMALPKPVPAAVLLVIAGVGLFFIVGAIAIIPAIPLLLAALLAYADKSNAPTSAPKK